MSASAPSRNGQHVTVKSLAAAKRLDPTWLAETLGVENLPGGGVAIPYFDEGGVEIYRRRRDVPGEPRFKQPCGVPLRPYGLWKLGEARSAGHLYVTEGESDCWSAWAAGLPALGIPGSRSARCLAAENVVGIDSIYVLPDADEAGEAFVKEVADSLAKFDWQGRLYRVSLPSGIKDASDWRKRAPERFVGELSEAVKLAQSITNSFRAPLGSGACAKGFFEPLPASLLAAEGGAANWRWCGYLAGQEVTLFSALWKAGKTTLLAHLLKALEKGGAFCGQEVVASTVLYVSEERAGRWVARRDEIGIGDHVHFLIRPFLQKPRHKDWLDLIDHVANCLAKRPADLVIFDTLSNLWPVQNENDAGEVGQALMPLHQLTDKAGLGLVHHVRKGDGKEATASRGSGALAAFCDTIIELRRFDANDRADRRRVLTGYGRWEETPAEVVVEWKPLGGGYRCLGAPADATRSARWQMIRGLLPSEPPGQTATDLFASWPAEKLKPGKRTLELDLQNGAAAGFWSMAGSGKKSDPLRFWANGTIPFAQGPYLKDAQKESVSSWASCDGSGGYAAPGYEGFTTPFDE
jgi:hypothetical protein